MNPKEETKRKKRYIAAFLLVMFAITIAYAAFGVNTPEVSRTVFFEINQKSPGEGIPHVDAMVTANFTAKGSISAGNDLKVDITVFDVNVTNLLDYYYTVGYDTEEGSAGSTPALKPVGNSFTENITVSFDTAVSLYWWLVPQAKYAGLGVANPSVTDPRPAIQIADISDTIAWSPKNHLPGSDGLS